MCISLEQNSLLFHSKGISIIAGKSRKKFLMDKLSQYLKFLSWILDNSQKQANANLWIVQVTLLIHNLIVVAGKKHIVFMKFIGYFDENRW